MRRPVPVYGLWRSAVRGVSEMTIPSIAADTSSVTSLMPAHHGEAVSCERPKAFLAALSRRPQALLCLHGARLNFFATPRAESRGRT